MLGGNWNNGTQGGGFNWNVNNSSRNRNRNHGSHLVHAKDLLKITVNVLPWLLPKHKNRKDVLVG